MWASQHIEQCAVSNPILRKELSHLCPRRERFVCVVKPFEVNCIVISFCACDIVCSSLYGDRGRCTCALLRFFSSSSFVPLCVQYYCVNTHLFVFRCSARVSWFRPLRLSASVPGRTVKNNQWSAEVCRLAGSCGGLRHTGCDRDSPLRLWLVSQSELRPRGEDWKDSETSNLGDLMHRVPDDYNILQLSFTPTAVYYLLPHISL